MPVPLHTLTAELLQTLGHPARVQVLELLARQEQTVADLLPEMGTGAANLSLHLALLRRAGLVAERKEGSAVYYSLTSEETAELLRVARLIAVGQPQLRQPARPAGQRPGALTCRRNEP